MAEHLDAIVAMRVEWITNLSEADRAALQNERAGYANEETKGAREAEMTASFQAADTN